MTIKENYIQIGILRKSFGTDGYLKLQLIEGFEKDLKKLKHLFLKVSGQYLPYFIEDIEINGDVLIKFDEISNPEETKTVLNLDVFIQDTQINLKNHKKGLLKTGVLDFQVFENEVLIGTVTDILEYPSQTMAEIEHQGNSFLIPLVEEFVKDIDLKNKKLYVSLPIGLMDINMGSVDQTPTEQ